jgi:predicted outer membrane protein
MTQNLFLIKNTKLIMKKLSILTTSLILAFTVGMAQTDTTTYERQQDHSEKSKDYDQKDQTFDENQEMNDASDQETWRSDTTDAQGTQQNRDWKADTTSTGSADYEKKDKATSAEQKDWKKDKKDKDKASYSGGSKDLSSDAKDFIENVTSGSAFNIQIAQVALQKENVPEEIREFGQQVVEDYSEANRELKSITEEHDLDISGLMSPSEDISTDRQRTINDIRDTDDGNFNQVLIDRMIMEHENLIGEFEKAKVQVENENLSSWIENTLPSLEDNLKKAYEIQAKLENGELNENENKDNEDDEGLF